MIATANRLNLVSEYYFATKLREIARMRQEGKPVLNLGIGSPDQPPHPDVVDALNDSAQSAAAHGYQSYTGLPALRTAWADWYARHYQCTLDPEHQILPLIGSKEGIAHIAFTFLEPGDVALIPNPGYPTYRAATLLAGAEARAYDLLEFPFVAAGSGGPGTNGSIEGKNHVDQLPAHAHRSNSCCGYFSQAD